jgi:predicted phage terminase large subunit-like protein
VRPHEALPRRRSGCRVISGKDRYAIFATVRQNHWDWYQSVARTRLEPGAAIVLIMTRWSEDDLAGRLLKQQEEGGEPWEVLRMPAIYEGGDPDPIGRKVGEALWPERWPLAALEKTRATLEPYWWLALYQQVPGPEGATEWPASYFNWPGFWFSHWPDDDDLMCKVLALDPSKGKDAKEGDYRAWIKLARDREKKLYVEADLRRDRSAEAMAREAVDYVADWHPDRLALEANGFQELLWPLFKHESRARQVPLPIDAKSLLVNTVSKEARIRRLGPYLFQRQMRFKWDSAGTRLLVEQLRQFPVGDHDDGPDALEQALRLMIGLVNERRRG